MFELASANDLIELKAKYLDKLYPEESQWGLKQFGTLFCYEQLRNQKGRFLEIGAGQNRFFDEHLDAKIDYWVVDSSGFYDAAKYKHSASLRKRTTLIDGMIGQFLPALPSESFDAIFSVSVLEHVPVARISDVCKDMYRLLKLGGYLIHSIDLTPGNYESIGTAFLRELQALGSGLN
jgi:SAM-dependent methyltransferase